MKNKTQEYINANSKKIDDSDIKRIIDSEDQLHEKLKKKSPLNRFLTDVQLFMGLIKDYYRGNYRKIPYKSIASIATALLYIINPIDIIPDIIPVIGQIDDALVFGVCLKLVESDLIKYQAWKQKNAIKHT